MSGNFRKRRLGNDGSGGALGESGSRRFRHPEPESSFSESKATKIMKLMGYREGQGLGKERQGIVEPVQVKERKGRQGLGHEHKILDEEQIPDYLEWNIEEEIQIEEKLVWIPPTQNPQPMPDIETLKTWLKVGPKKLILDDETEFVTGDILKWILRCKSALDHFTDNELFQARSRSNPFETIRKGIFINRAAMKMANIDAVLNFKITNSPSIEEKDLLYFADICAGPGGFSEYVLWKKKWLTKGFGFTLKGDCDFKLSDFISGHPESFEAHYGVKGDGDIYNPDNCDSFIDYVLMHTDGLGVHFVMADGGFSVKGQENIQEILSRQLYLSQAMVALGIVRENGHFICKLFDVFTPFSVGLVFLMRLCFNQVALLKPNTSRPANSERYLICQGRKQDISPIFRYLKECHQTMWSWKSINEDKSDILEIVPLHILKDEDDPFLKYILEDNNENGIRQIQNLRKIVQFYRDRNLQEDRQWETRRDCLAYWKIPSDKIRQRDDRADPSGRFRELLDTTNCTYTQFEKAVDKNLTSEIRATQMRSPYNWKLCIVENGSFSKNRGYFLSLGRSRIFKYDGYGTWTPMNHFAKFEMSPNTLVYGEIVMEYHGLVPSQTKAATFHIIDALILGGKDIRSLILGERNQWCHAFAKAMNKTYSVSGYGSFRAKEMIPVEDFRILQRRLTYGLATGCGKMERLLAPVLLGESEEVEMTNSTYIQPDGILFLQEIKDPWLVAISRSHRTKYYFDHKTGHRDFNIPPNAIADFVVTMQSRIFWEWGKGVDLSYPREPERADSHQVSSNKVHVEELIDYVEEIKKEGVK